MLQERGGRVSCTSATHKITHHTRWCVRAARFLSERTPHSFTFSNIRSARPSRYYTRTPRPIFSARPSRVRIQRKSMIGREEEKEENDVHHLGLFVRPQGSNNINNTHPEGLVRSTLTARWSIDSWHGTKIACLPASRHTCRLENGRHALEPRDVKTFSAISHVYANRGNRYRKWSRCSFQKSVLNQDKIESAPLVGVFPPLWLKRPSTSLLR